MTRDEASDAAAELNAEHPQRDLYRWVVREGEHGEWFVARVRMPTPRKAERFTLSSPAKQPTPPEEHPLDLPGGLPPWSAGG